MYYEEEKFRLKKIELIKVFNEVIRREKNIEIIFLYVSKNVYNIIEKDILLWKY